MSTWTDDETQAIGCNCGHTVMNARRPTPSLSHVKLTTSQPQPQWLTYLQEVQVSSVIRLQDGLGVRMGVVLCGDGHDTGEFWVYQRDELKAWLADVRPAVQNG